MKKALKIIFAVVLMITSVNTFADVTMDNELTYSRYQELVQQGAIGEDVSYEQLVQVNKEAQELEKSLDNNPNFKRIKRSASDINTLYPGDVVVTNSSSYGGLTGHAAIAIGYDTVIQSSLGNPTKTMSWSDFKESYRFGYIKVYRPTNDSDGKAAARWAENTYAYSSVPYVITGDLTTTSQTYCAKIVWQAYYYGVGRHAAVAPQLHNTIVSPYTLDSMITIIRYVGRIN